MTRYPHIARMIYGQPWAILPEKLEELVATFDVLADGSRFSADEVNARLTGAGRQMQTSMRMAGRVAVIPVCGTIAQRAGMMQNTSGGCSTADIGNQVSQALADPGVGALLLDMSSPGGGTYGVGELAQQIYDGRQSRGGRKPIVGIANSMAASAAYWIACACDELVVTPGGEVGSIGVFTVYQDISKALAAEGIATTIIRAGKYKAEATGYTPLSEEAQQSLQARCDQVYADFTAMVAKARGVPVARVRDGMGQGRLVGAKDAVAAGMADRVATFGETLARLGGDGRALVGRTPGNSSGSVMRAEEDARQRRYRLAFAGGDMPPGQLGDGRAIAGRAPGSSSGSNMRAEDDARQRRYRLAFAGGDMPPGQPGNGRAATAAPSPAVRPAVPPAGSQGV